MKKSELRQIIREEISKVLKESSNLPVTITSVNGKSFYFTKGSFKSPKTDGAGFIQQLRDVEATAPDGYPSAEMWVHDNQVAALLPACSSVRIVLCLDS